VVCFPDVFELQSTPLTLADFEAAITVTNELNAFMFFNCGAFSGASVPHKHMQIIPFASLSDDGLLPIEKAFLEKQGEDFAPFSGLKHQFMKIDKYEAEDVH
jgi:sulfate adenylyltransferase (ADP) / ATP adenylyltransferase